MERRSTQSRQQKDAAGGVKQGCAGPAALRQAVGPPVQGPDMVRRSGAGNVAVALHLHRAVFRDGQVGGLLIGEVILGCLCLCQAVAGVVAEIVEAQGAAGAAVSVSR